MIFDGFWVLSNTDRTWFSMFFIKKRNFRDFQENPSLLPFDRFPKSWETPHFLGCEICYWQQDVSKDPKRWIRRKIIRFFVSDCQWEKVLFADFDIQNSRILQLYEFVWDEKCFWILCLKCVVQGTEQYHCSGYRRRINNILKRYHGDKLSLLQLCSSGRRLEVDDPRHLSLQKPHRRSEKLSRVTLVAVLPKARL